MSQRVRPTPAMVTLTLGVALVWLCTSLPRTQADASTRTVAAAASSTLTISAPTSANLGTGTTSTASLTASLGDITVTETSGASLLQGWTTTVSTTGFTTTAGAMSRTIPAAQVSYLSSAGTQSGIMLANCVTSATRQTLVVPRAAYTCGGATSVGTATLRWNPTISVTLPPGILAGTYRGSITHSVS